MRTIAVGDPHGCCVELQDLLEKLAFGADDRLILLGDLIDRGPDPVGVVRLARNLKGQCVTILGNHDDTALRWLKHETKRAQDPTYAHPMKPPLPKRLEQWLSLSEEDVAYLAACPVIYRPLPGWIAVHGGLMPRVPPEKQKASQLVRCRWVDEKGAYVGLKRPDDPPEMPPGAMPWAHAWDGTESVVYGHEVFSEEQPQYDRRPNGAECWGLDTGCCHGGRLTALILETREVVQVQARQQYARRGWVSTDD